MAQASDTAHDIKVSRDRFSCHEHHILIYCTTLGSALWEINKTLGIVKTFLNLKSNPILISYSTVTVLDNDELQVESCFLLLDQVSFEY